MFSNNFLSSFVIMISCIKDPFFISFNVNKNNNLGIDVIINKPISMIEINKLINEITKK